MVSLGEQIEGVIFQALPREVRRSILKMISSVGSVSYSELTPELGISTGKLNYNLEQLQGLIEESSGCRYVFAPFGKREFSQLNLIKERLTQITRNT